MRNLAAAELAHEYDEAGDSENSKIALQKYIKSVHLVIDRGRLSCEKKRVLFGSIEESEVWRSWLEEDGADPGYDSELALLRIACEPLVANQVLILETESNKMALKDYINYVSAISTTLDTSVLSHAERNTLIAAIKVSESWLVGSRRQGISSDYNSLLTSLRATCDGYAISYEVNKLNTLIRELNGGVRGKESLEDETKIRFLGRCHVMARFADQQIAHQREALTLEDILDMQRQFLVFAAEFGIIVMTKSGEPWDGRWPRNLLVAQSSYLEYLKSATSTGLERCLGLNILGTALNERYGNLGNVEDLERAITCHREALLFCPTPSDDRVNSLHSLGVVLLSRFECHKERDDLDEAIAYLRDSIKLMRASGALRSEFLHDLGHSLEMRFELLFMITDLDEAIFLEQEAIDLTPSSSPGYPAALCNFGTLLTSRFIRLKKETDINQAIMLQRDAIALTEHNCPDRALYFANLGNSLLLRFEHLGEVKDFYQAVVYQQEAIELSPSGSSQRSSCISNLGILFAKRFDHFGEVKDIDHAISLQVGALSLATHDSESLQRSDLLVKFGSMLSKRFKYLGEGSDLHQAIAVNEEAITLTLHCPAYLHNLFDKTGSPEDLREALTQYSELEVTDTDNERIGYQFLRFAADLHASFGQSDKIEDLETAIALSRECLTLLPVHHPNHLAGSNNFANALVERFNRLGRQEDLDEAISVHREELERLLISDPRRPRSLNNLAGALTIRYHYFGRPSDIDEAISVHREVLEQRLAPHPERSRSLNNIASALTIRFHLYGRGEDLTEAIILHREALKLEPPPHFDQCNTRYNLAIALTTQFLQSGRREDLDEAISLHRDVLELRPAPHPNRPDTLDNIASVLVIRFFHSGRHEDLDNAILLQREVLEKRPAPHPGRSGCLNNIACALESRFKQSGQCEDLELAISLYREALELQPPAHPGRSNTLNNLACALETRFQQFGQHDDLDAAILLHRDTLQLRPPPHPDRSSSLSNLAGGLTSRFKQAGRHEDIDEAIRVYRQSLEALVIGQPSVSPISANLGRALMTAYTNTRESMYLEEAMAAFRVAVTCKSASAFHRHQAAVSWAKNADSTHKSALDAYHFAIELLPLLATLGLDLNSRYLALTSVGDGLARDAASCAIRLGQYGSAVELLEEGRAVFWSQALQLRTPMADLHEAAPELETELRHISLALEQGSLRDLSRNVSNTHQKIMSMEEEASHFSRLDDQWMATLEKVRLMDGFQDFLRPSRLSTLQRAAVNEPVVILNASKTGCDALILTPAAVQHVPFPELTLDDVTRLARLLQVASEGRDASLPESDRAYVEGVVQRMSDLPDTLQMLGLPDETRHVKRASSVVGPEYIFRLVLAVLWTSVAMPVIRMLNLEKSDKPPMLRWCPTGPFTFIPIHAAGIYNTEMVESVFDYVVSSYLPTLSSVVSDITLPTEPFKMLAVIQPKTPGQKSLPCTVEELRRIERHAPKDSLVALLHGSVNDVISQLPATSIAHFACHGQQNPRNPLESALILQDGPLKVSQFMQQSMPKASLAYLSACETAMGDENLPDEVIHLGSALLFAKFREVIATMWSICDSDGPKVADSFYEYIFRGNISTGASRFDTSQAARALHLAVAKLRAEKVSFVRWVPFVHLGK